MTKEHLFNQLVTQLSSPKLFFGHAVVDAQDEAMMILIKLCKQDVEQILATGSHTVTPALIAQANKIAQLRLSSLTPMAYILGEVRFAGLKFNIDARALVPRSPIAELIINGFKPWVNMQNITSVLDLCTGSGCIGISIAQHFEHTNVDISDISVQALALAQTNIDLHQVNRRVKTIESDLLQSVNKSYDLIVTNPPYVSEEEYQELPREYKHEPKLGLITKQQGLKIPVEILRQAPKYLNENGYLFLEVGYSDNELVATFPIIQFQWIDFLNGGQGVCVFSKKMLLEYQHYFKQFLESDDVI
ncbi:Ribosomal protein L3 N(5)-glutamine methyltransferase [hydrothermal vent metagenome]|uniref:Ribosomal protein L3 N(5)-glutamine methyltransferase n=1 Tax=hydrothermal vent metagenome TaxID=652676 RepID=A0A3B0VS08_9ZZZZ